MADGLNGLKTYETPHDICLHKTQAWLPFTTRKDKGLTQASSYQSCGQIKTASVEGARYLLIFVDDFSLKVFIYHLKKKKRLLRFTYRNSVNIYFVKTQARKCKEGLWLRKLTEEIASVPIKNFVTAWEQLHYLKMIW